MLNDWSNSDYTYSMNKELSKNSLIPILILWKKRLILNWSMFSVSNMSTSLPTLQSYCITCIDYKRAPLECGPSVPDYWSEI